MCEEHGCGHCTGEGECNCDVNEDTPQFSAETEEAMSEFITGELVESQPQEPLGKILLGLCQVVETSVWAADMAGETESVAKWKVLTDKTYDKLYSIIDAIEI